MLRGRVNKLNNILYYTSTDNNIVTPHSPSALRANIVSNTYENGIGTIIFDRTLVEIGYMAFASCNTLRTILFPESLRKINGWAFENCKGLTTIYIPERIKEIINGLQGTFNGCTALTTISVVSENPIYSSEDDCNGIIEKSSDTLLLGCNSTEIPSSVTSIGNGAYYGGNIVSINLQDNINEIKSYAFYLCNDLKTVTASSSLASIGSNAFNYAYNMEGFTFNGNPPSLGDNTLSNTNNCPIYVPAHLVNMYKEAEGWSSYANRIQSIIVPSDEIWYTSTDGSVVTPYATGTNVFGANIISNTYSENKGIIKFDGTVISIGDNAFKNCTKLETITNSSYVTTIGSSAFYDCSNLIRPPVLDSITSIGSAAFHNCRKITSLVLPDSVTTIVSCAFEYCFGLSTVSLSASITSIGSFAFYSCSQLSSFTGTYTGISEDGKCLLVNNTLNSFAPYDLTSYNIPDGVISIGEGVFSNSVLTSITIPNSVISIGRIAFSYCTKLTSIVIPSSVTSIGERAFKACIKLNSIICRASAPPSLGYDVFIDTNDCPIYVPSGSVDAYRIAEDWSTYASRIQAIS